MAEKTTRESIIAVGTGLIAVHGFNATGLDAVLRESKVPKGSFYHYFSSKEDFGLAVIDAYAAEYDAKLTALFDPASGTPLERLHRYFAEGFAENSECACLTGCLIGNLGQEMAAQNERFRLRIDEILESWTARIRLCLDEAKQCGELNSELDSSAYAQFFISGWEGAVLRAKISNSPEPLKIFTELVFSRMLSKT